MNTELRRRGSHDIPIEMLHVPVVPEYREFSNVWESLDDNKRKTNILLEKLCTIEKLFQTSTTAAESSAIVAHASTRSLSRWRSKQRRVKQVCRRSHNQIQQRKPQLFSLWEGWPSEKNCRKLRANKNKSVVTDSIGSSSMGDTRGSAFSAVTVNSMRLENEWVCDSGALHHMTANKQYFAT